MKIITAQSIPWQVPVITERMSYGLLKERAILTSMDYMAIPWATIFDRASHLSIPANEQVKSIQRSNNNGFTVCQHIRWQDHIDIFESLGISLIFSSHAIRKFKHPSIKVLPFSIFAANVKPPENVKDIFCSFIGYYNENWYLSNVRDKIFKMYHPSSSYIKKREQWHFEDIVYTGQIKKQSIDSANKQNDLTNEKEYKDVLAKSVFSLCPSGTGPNTIRIWESLAAGAIPVIISDKIWLPEIKELNWKNCSIQIKEKNVDDLYNILSKISLQDIKEMRKNCIKYYQLISGKNFIYPIRYHFSKLSQN